MVKKALVTVLAAISFALIAAFSLPGQAVASEGESENPGDVVCLAIDHCPELPPPDRCDPAGNCEVPPEPGCYEGPNGECLPPWCDPSRPISDCPVKPPHPPFCEDGSELCIPPMPPWCDEAGNCEPPPRPPICEEGQDPAVESCMELPPACSVDEAGVIDCLPPWCDPEAPAEECPSEPPAPPICDENSGPEDFCIPPKCDPAETNPKFCRPYPEDPIVCVMGWPSDEPMPDCPGIYPPPFCGDEGGDIRPLPAPHARIKFPGREELCPPRPPYCDSTEPGASDPGEGGEDVSKYRSDEIPGEGSDETVEDPLPCIYPPFYGCFEDADGNILCVDPPPGCWEEDGKEDLIACFSPVPGNPETTDNGEVKRNNKGKAAKAKARAKAKAAKARAKAKAKKVKATKAKAKAKARR